MDQNIKPNLDSSAQNSVPFLLLKKQYDGTPPSQFILSCGDGLVLDVDVDGRGQSLVIWGGGAVIALLLVGNKIPVVKNDILKKIPLVRGYFIEQDNIPDSDKPF
jgi:hypothetical protein